MTSAERRIIAVEPFEPAQPTITIEFCRVCRDRNVPGKAAIVKRDDGSSVVTLCCTNCQRFRAKLGFGRAG